MHCGHHYLPHRVFLVTCTAYQQLQNARHHCDRWDELRYDADPFLFITCTHKPGNIYYTAGRPWPCISSIPFVCMQSCFIVLNISVHKPPLAPLALLASYIVVDKHYSLCEWEEAMALQRNRETSLCSWETVP